MATKEDKRFKLLKNDRRREDKYKSVRKKKRKGFHGSKEPTTSNILEESVGGDVVDEALSHNKNDSGGDLSSETYTSVMENKQGREIGLTPKKLTRKRKLESSFLSPQSVTPVSGYKIIDSSILNDIMNSVFKCPSCGEEKTLELHQDNGKRKGMCETLLLFCRACNQYINKHFKTSKVIKNIKNKSSGSGSGSGSKVHDINLRSVVATTSAGGGLTTLRRICTDFNFPEPVTENAYNRYIRTVEEKAVENCDRSMADAGHKLRTMMLDGEDDDGRLIDVSVSVDGTWQKRYGFNSLVGMVFIISIDTGEVLDYVVKYKTCHQCKMNPNASDKWKGKHAKVCCINHEGSSGSMETAGAIEMFLRSIEKHNLRYTTYVGDGDSSAFGKVLEALKEKYGDQYPCEKEDCIGHIQKRMGTALRLYKNNHRGVKLSDGKGVGGSGRLTDALVDRIQTYYGYAIRNNKGNIENIRKAIWAIYFHTIAGPQDESLVKQHSYCPQTEDTWCKYHRDIIQRTESYNKSKCLPFIFREELKPIFLRLSSDEVLLGCQRGLTQNQNEALNGVIWSRCPKRLFCGTHRLTISVCDGVTQFNDGAKGRYHLFKTLRLNSHENSLKGLQREHRSRLRKAATKITARYKKRRQTLRQLRKTKKTDKSYIAGGFAKKSVPEIDFTIEPVITEPVIEPAARLSVDPHIEIKFIHDDDVIQHIYNFEY